MRGDPVLNPGHPLWKEFLSKLSRASLCRGTTTHARAALMTMTGIDAEETLRTLAALGGSCDCAIEFDIAPLERGERGERGHAERVEGAA